jgi:hypothetical protein
MKLKAIRLLLVPATLMLLLVACGDNELTVSEVPDGFVSYEDRSHGFSISYPKTWINHTAEKVRSIQGRTVEAAQISPNTSLKDLSPEQVANMTDLWFVADGGTRGVDWSEVRIFEDTAWAEAGQKFDRKFAEADLKAQFENGNFKLIKQEFGKINGFDAGILDYTYEVRLVGPTEHGTQRIVSLSTEYVTVMCLANTFTEGIAIPNQELADTCWKILRSFRLER